MPDVVLTPHQQYALNWLVTRIVDGAKLVALRGLAGTGKTSMIPALRKALAEHDITTVVGSPTHRAAMILRQKGITEADTVHAQALMPYFTPDYVQCLRWLGETKGTQRLGTEEAPHAEVEGLPWLVYEAVKPDLAKGRDLHRQRRYPAKKRLASIGIHGKDHFAGFGAKAGEGVLLIDEASMVGGTMLATCQEAYQQIILIGDPGQLPPVKDTAVLAEADGRDLTEIHRQASDSPIIKLAYRARQGEPFWRDTLPGLPASLVEGGVCSHASVQAKQFLQAPLIVWRNVTRLTCTHQIRHALGYAKDQLVPGEPLVCRATSQEDRAEGFYNNGLYRIVEVDPANPRLVTVEDALGEASTIQVHLEELDGDSIDPRAIPFRLGYCLTAHTAQGGEWPIVYLAMPDLLAYAKMCLGHGRQDELAQWSYTAITRAKETLGLLTNYHFLAEEPPMAAPKVQPPSSPMLNNEPEPVQDASLDPLFPMLNNKPEPIQDASLDPLLLTAPPEPDDIPDPVVPASASPTLPAVPDIQLYEALLQGFCQHLQRRLDNDVMDHHRGVMRALDSVCQTVKSWMEGMAQGNEHAQYQLSDALLKLQQQGLQLRHDPYTVDVQATSPHGYPVTFHIAKSTAPELLAELPDVVAWLANNSYKPAA